MRRAALVALLLVATAEAQQVIAPASTERGAIVAGKDGLVLPAGEFAVAELIDAVAAFLCRNYLYDPAVVGRAQGFSLHKAMALDALGAEELMHALLAARSLAAVPIDELRGVHQVVGLADDRGSLPALALPWRSPNEILRRPRLRELIVTAIELDGVDVEHFAAALRSRSALLGQWRPGILVAWSVRPRTLVLHGYRDEIAQVIQMARQICGPPTTPDDSLRRRIDALERELADLRTMLAGRPR